MTPPPAAPTSAMPNPAGPSRSRWRNTPPTRGYKTSSDEGSAAASFSGYPGQVQEPASSRVPVPMFGEDVMADGGFLEDTKTQYPMSPRYMGPSAMEMVDQEMQQESLAAGRPTMVTEPMAPYTRNMEPKPLHRQTISPSSTPPRHRHRNSPLARRPYPPSDDENVTTTYPSRPRIVLDTNSAPIYHQTISPSTPPRHVDQSSPLARLPPASSDEESTIASYSGYPGRGRNPASSRVPAPMFGEDIVKDGAFLEDTMIQSPVSPRHQGPSAMEKIDRQIQQESLTAGRPTLVTHPSVMSPIGEAHEPYEGERVNQIVAADMDTAQPKPRGAVRFRLAGMVVQAAQKVSAGTVNLARRTSLGSGAGSRRQSTAQPTIDSPSRRPPREPEEPIANRLHAGPGGVFEPEPPTQTHPAVRTLLERVASTKRPAGWRAPAVESVATSEIAQSETSSRSPVESQPAAPPLPRTQPPAPFPVRRRSTQRSSNNRYQHQPPQPEDRTHGFSPATENPTSPVSEEGSTTSSAVIPRQSRKRAPLYRDPSYRVGGSRLRDPRQGPSSISHEGPTTEDHSHEHTHESSRPLVAQGTSSSSRAARHMRRGGQFKRNVVGMDLFAEQLVEEPASIIRTSYISQRGTGWEPLFALRRVLREALYLPLRSKTHVTVSYIPARSKPDGKTDPEPWYIPKPPKPSKQPPGIVIPTIALSNRPAGPYDRRAQLKAGSRRRAKRTRPSEFSNTQPQPILHVVERDPSHRSRYMTQDQMAAGQPIQILSEDAPPRIIAPGGMPMPYVSYAPSGSGSPPTTWFTHAAAST